jgi:putative flippase GtrA
MKMPLLNKERSRFLRFALVGSFGAIIDFGIFNLLTQNFSISAVAASVISFVAAVFSNFTWNRYWTYPDSRSKHIAHQLSQFLLISFIGLIIRTPLFAYLENISVQYFTKSNLLLPFTPTFIGHNISLAIAIIVVMLWNFFANRFWTYADVE